MRAGTPPRIKRTKIEPGVLMEYINLGHTGLKVSRICLEPVINFMRAT
jgi:hypothetical protein